MVGTQNAAQLALNRVLAATDFGLAAETATAYAAALARHFDSTLTVAHVIDLSIASPSEAAIISVPREQMWHNSLIQMDRVIHRLNRLGVNVRGREIEAHHPAAAILGLAEVSHADVVVIGTNARHGLNKLILGSFAEDVIHHANCPVITLGPKVKAPEGSEFLLRKVVFATDLHHQAVEKAATALAFAKTTLAEVTICHVLDGSGEGELGLADIESQSELALLRVAPPSVYGWCHIEYVLRTGRPGERILDLARHAEADLIVVGARRRSGCDTAHLTAGVVEQLLAGAECPVMTLCIESCEARHGM